MARIVFRMSRSPPRVALSKLMVFCRSDVDQDEETLETQIREQEAAKRREAEALEREAELARQRLEEERLAKEEEERRQTEREKALEKKGVGRGVSRTVDSSSSGVRGVRGTRASLRARGVATGIARGGIVPLFNARDGAYARNVNYIKVQPALRVPERPAFLDPLPLHQLGSHRAVVGAPNGNYWN